MKYLAPVVTVEDLSMEDVVMVSLSVGASGTLDEVNWDDLTD